jgi:hypothetical protein
LLAAFAVLIGAAFTGPVAIAGAEPGPHVLHQHTPDPQTHPERRVGSFVVAGAVAHRLRLDVADLRGLPSRTVEVTFKSGSGVEHHVYVGPRLLDVLATAGPTFDPAIKNDKLRYFVSVSASDGYRALVAYCEIDPSFEAKDVLLATSEDGRSLAADGPRLVVPGDIAGGRYVTNIIRVSLGKPES